MMGIKLVITFSGLPGRTVRKCLHNIKYTLLLDVSHSPRELPNVSFDLAPYLIPHQSDILLIRGKLQFPQCVDCQLVKVAILEYLHLCHPAADHPSVLLLFQHDHHLDQGGLELLDALLQTAVVLAVVDALPRVGRTQGGVGGGLVDELLREFDCVDGWLLLLYVLDYFSMGL
jgi:hypothetical protein